MDSNERPSTPRGGHSLQDLMALQRDDVFQSLFLKSKEDLNDKGNQFIPRGALFQIIDERRVKDIAELLFGGDCEDSSALGGAASRISPPRNQGCHCRDPLCTGSRIMFTALLLTPRHDILIPFLKYPNREFCDAKLPLEDPRRIWSDNTVLGKHGEFTDQQTRLFLHWQSRMRAPFFKPSSTQASQETVQQSASLEIEDEVTLPWVHVETILRAHKKAAHQSTSGDRSLVQRITIDRDHHELGGEDDSFALKSFEMGQSASTLSFEGLETEAKINRIISHHDHIVPLLVAFKHRRASYLLFPWASGGNLRDVWSKYTTNQDGVESGLEFAWWYSLQWLLDECRGLADALATVHGFAGTESNKASLLIHADIKPQNILCFARHGSKKGPFTLKLADFGLSRRITEGQQLNVDNFPHTQTYRPPEYDVGGGANLNYDVWCLGCVFLEFITWALLGQDGVLYFIEDRASEGDDSDVDSSSGALSEDTFFKKVATRSKIRSLSKLKFHIDTQKDVEKTRSVKRHSISISRDISFRVKDNVVNHIENLKQSNSNDKLNKFLNFIQRNMLVIDHKERKSSDQVRNFLDSLSR